MRGVWLMWLMWLIVAHGTHAAALAPICFPKPIIGHAVPSGAPPTTQASGASMASAPSAMSIAETFARAPDYETARISPDGRYLAVTKYDEGFRVLVVLDRTTLDITHIQKFNPPNEIADFVWVKDHRLLVSLASQVGSLDAPVRVRQRLPTWC